MSSTTPPPPPPPSPMSTPPSPQKREEKQEIDESCGQPDLLNATFLPLSGYEDMYGEAAWIQADDVAARSVRCNDEEERCSISVQQIAKEEEMVLKKKLRQQRKWDLNEIWFMI